MSEALQERGIWAERYVRDFLALPFISEFVFRSLQTLDGGTQKESCGFARRLSWRWHIDVPEERVPLKVSSGLGRLRSRGNRGGKGDEQEEDFRRNDGRCSSDEKPSRGQNHAAHLQR
jgi:hypothetical protein